MGFLNLLYLYNFVNFAHSLDSKQENLGKVSGKKFKANQNPYQPALFKH